MTLTPENPSFATARLLLDEAARNGVTAVMIAPGSRSAALALAFYADARFHVYTEIDERSAGFFALGYARITGNVMPIVVTSGSAVAQLHPAVIEADAAGIALLVLSADRPVELRNTGANQTIRQAGLFGDALRLAATIEVVDDHERTNRYVRSVVQQALSAACGGAQRPGPVQLNMAFREPTIPVNDDGRAPVVAAWTELLHGRADNVPWAPLSAPTRTADQDFVRMFVHSLAGRSGVLVAGQLDGANRNDLLVTAVDRLASRLGWPVLAEVASELRRCTHAVAHLSSFIGNDTFAARYAPDVVLRFGRTGITAGLDSYVRAATTDVLVDPYGTVFDPDRHVTHRVIADPLLFIAAVEAELDATQTGTTATLASVFATASATVGAVFDTLLAADEHSVLTEPLAVRVLADVLDATDTLVVGSSMPIRDLDSYAPHTLRAHVVANRGASGIDGFVSTTRGVATAVNRFTVGVCGDVTFLHDINGLLLKGSEVPVAIVVLDNDGGAIFSFLPQAAYPEALEQVFTMPHGRDVAAIAAAYGARAVTADTVAALRDALAAAKTHAGVTVIRVKSDRQACVALHRQLRSQTDAALQHSDVI